MTLIRGKQLQLVLDEAALKLKTAHHNCGYVSNFGVSVIELIAEQTGFELGISSEAHSLGPSGHYAPMLMSFLTGQYDNSSRIHTQGVNTDGSQVRQSKLGNQHRFWFLHLCRQIEKLLSGDESAVNAIAHPIAKHTFKDKAYKPCSTYVQYQFHMQTNSLSVVANYRSQHLFMLAINVQQWAFQLMQLCHRYQLRLGSVVLNCTNHHVKKGQDGQKVRGKPIPWFVEPGETSELVRKIESYYSQF